MEIIAEREGNVEIYRSEFDPQRGEKIEVFVKECDGETLVSIGGGEGMPVGAGYTLKIAVYDAPKPLKFPCNTEAELTFEDGVTLRLKTSADMCEQYYVGRDIEFVDSETNTVRIAKCVGFKEL